MAFLVARTVDEWRARFGTGSTAPRTVLTIGNFDGVHRGHQEILTGVLQHARREKSLATVVTFDPHPLRVLRPESAPATLMPLGERLQIFDEMGMDAALVLHFDHAFSLVSPQEFVQDILVDALRAKAVLLGENFRFGHRHAGDVNLLSEMGHRLGFEVVTLPPVEFRGEIISSTAVRDALHRGNVSRAGRMLGRPFSLHGEIQHGAGIGRKLVVPTLNLSTAAQILPKNGVYVTETKVGAWWYRSVTNVGIRPTFHSGDISVESFLFGFSAALTEGSMAVRFWTRLRDERKFAGPEELRSQIRHDSACAQQFFRLLPTKL
jgi:riboflavin kinase/FMN adenylyltransferase